MPSFTLIFLAGAGGTISGASVQVIPQGGNATPVTAVANSGFAFTGWDDDILNNPRADMNIQVGRTVTANFSALPSGGLSRNYLSDSVSV